MREPLYEPELPLVDTPAQDTLAQRFAAFDKENPEVYNWIRYTAYSMIAQGAKYLSMKGIFEHLRGTFGGVARLNNSYTSFYTDKLVAECPNLAPLFRRRARAKGRMALHYARAH